MNSEVQFVGFHLDFFVGERVTVRIESNGDVRYVGGAVTSKSVDGNYWTTSVDCDDGSSVDVREYVVMAPRV
jgi:hypothetical protein